MATKTKRQIKNFYFSEVKQYPTAMDSTISAKKRKLSSAEEVKPVEEPEVKKCKKEQDKSPGKKSKAQDNNVETPTTDFGELSLGKSIIIFSFFF